MLNTGILSHRWFTSDGLPCSQPTRSNIFRQSGSYVSIREKPCRRGCFMLDSIRLMVSPLFRPLISNTGFTSSRPNEQSNPELPASLFFRAVRRRIRRRVTGISQRLAKPPRFLPEFYAAFVASITANSCNRQPVRHEADGIHHVMRQQRCSLLVAQVCPPIPYWLFMMLMISEVAFISPSTIVKLIHRRKTRPSKPDSKPSKHHQCWLPQFLICGLLLVERSAYYLSPEPPIALFGYTPNGVKKACIEPLAFIETGFAGKISQFHKQEFHSQFFHVSNVRFPGQM